VLIDALKDVAEGDADLTKTISVKSKDETSVVAHYFNIIKMVKGLSNKLTAPFEIPISTKP
jgi:methyl-accepting chemotaxis protein